MATVAKERVAAPMQSAGSERVAPADGRAAAGVFEEVDEQLKKRAWPTRPPHSDRPTRPAYHDSQVIEVVVVVAPMVAIFAAPPALTAATTEIGPSSTLRVASAKSSSLCQDKRDDGTQCQVTCQLAGRNESFAVSGRAPCVEKFCGQHKLCWPRFVGTAGTVGGPCRSGTLPITRCR